MKARVMNGDQQLFYGPVDKVSSEQLAGLIVVGFALRREENVLFDSTEHLSLTYLNDDDTVRQEFPDVTLRHHTIIPVVENVFNNPYIEEILFDFIPKKK